MNYIANNSEGNKQEHVFVLSMTMKTRLAYKIAAKIMCLQIYLDYERFIWNHWYEIFSDV